MKRSYTAQRVVAALALLSLLFSAAAQEKHNFLAIDNQLYDEAGPYYFISQGDNNNAYVKAAPFAKALGLQLSFDASNDTLVFRKAGTIVRLQATSDISRGLVKRPDALIVNGEPRASPMAILVGGDSYVAITPIVKAFGGNSRWYAEQRLITVETAELLSPLLTPPRLGVSNGISRIAIDLPKSQKYSLAVRGDTLIITFTDTRAPAFESAPDDPNISHLSFEALGSDSGLIIQARYPLSADGGGFEPGKLTYDDRDVLYIDLAPGLQGGSAATLITEDTATPQAALPDTPKHQVVVIDPGHGGKFAGAQGFAKEEILVLLVALKLKALLEENGVEVILTRDRDVELSDIYYQDLAARARYATPETNLFVSLHANAAPDERASGIETWVFGKPLDPSLIDVAIEENGGGDAGRALTQEALQVANGLAGDILRETQLSYSLNLAEAVQQNLVDATGARDRGVRQNVFYVIRNARTPAILVELGFVSNPQEGQKLVTEAYQDLLAKALAGGILEFLSTGGTLARR